MHRNELAKVPVIPTSEQVSDHQPKFDRLFNTIETSSLALSGHDNGQQYTGSDPMYGPLTICWNLCLIHFNDQLVCFEFCSTPLDHLAHLLRPLPVSHLFTPLQTNSLRLQQLSRIPRSSCAFTPRRVLTTLRHPKRGDRVALPHDVFVIQLKQLK
jgi:hypothetical protein